MRSLLSALTWTLLGLMVDVGAVYAQQGGSRIYRIGWLWIGSPGLVPTPIGQWTGLGAAFRDPLRDSGFVVGNEVIE